jgi:hypothetical protein
VLLPGETLVANEEYLGLTGGRVRMHAAMVRSPR